MATEKDVLELEIGIDVKKAVEDLGKLKTKGKTNFKALSAVTRTFGQGVRRFVQDPLNKVSKSIKDAAHQYTLYGKTTEKYNALIARSQKKLSAASDKDRKKFKDDIEKYKKFKQEALRDLKSKKGISLGGRIGRGATSLKENLPKAASAANSGIGETITKSFEVGGSLLRKDLEGAIEGAVHALKEPFDFGAKVLDKTLVKGFRKTGSFFWKTGDKSFKRAGQLWSKGGKGGKAGAVGMAALGGVSKLVGGLGTMIGTTLSKSLSAISGSMGGIASVAGLIVKLFMQMEEQAKSFNKDILQSTDSSELLYANGMDSNLAFKSLSGTLDKMRDAAFDVGQNLQWGVTSQEHKEFEQTLAAEGVDLRTMKKEFRDAQNSAHGMTGEVQDWGDAVHVAVAFSRNWGVSLQEITSFQSEMMRDVGASFDSTMLSMAKMSRASAESGIATNKFFAIIRGVSADLSLYNTRIDQATSLLKLMGKYMSPREAQKYMSTLTGMYKQLGEEDRIRQVYLMGVGKAQQIVIDDLKDKTENLGIEIQKQTGISAKDFEDAMANSAKDGGKAMEGILKEAGSNLKGSQREAIVALQMDYKRVQKGGAVGIAEAMQNLSAAGAVTATKAALQRFGGGKKLSDMIGLQAFAARKAAGVSQDQFDQAVKLEKAIDDQRDEIASVLNGTSRMSEDDQKTLRKRLEDLGITQENVGKTSDAKIVSAMDEGQQKALTDAQSEENFAKQQVKLTQTLGDKMGVIIDGIFNYLYQALKGVVETLDEFFEFISSSKLFGGDDPKKARRAEIRALQQNGDQLSKDLINALQQNMASKSVKDAVHANLKNGGDVQDTLQSVFADMSHDQEVSSAKLLKGLDPKKQQAVMASLDDGRGLLEALNKAGFTPDEMKNILDQLLNGLTEEQIAKAATHMSILKGGLGSQVPGGTKPLADADTDLVDRESSAQTKASVTSGGPSAPDAPVPPTASAPQSPGGTGAPTGGMSEAHQAAASLTGAATPMTDDQGEELLSGMDGLQRVLSQKGIKINQSFLRDKFWKNGHDAVLDANREALFEYFMYSKADPGMVAKGLKDGSVDALTFGNKFLDQVKKTGAVPGTLDGFASGGVIPQPKSPDQVFVAARPGETITPAGGGGSSTVTIPINVTAGPGLQDLGDMMRSAALTTVAEWERKRKFR